MAAPLILVDHPLIQHKLSHMRDKHTPPGTFRRLLREISMLMAYEVTRDLPLGSRRVETPVAPMKAPVLAGREPILAAILRAGLGIVDGMLEVLTEASVGHVGLYRDAETLEAVEYYFKMPADISERTVLAVDPMLATGNSSIAAVERILREKPKSLKLVCLVAAPEGVKAFHEHFPGIPIYTAALDECLDDHAYIVPGLGDAGDRLFGT